MSDKKKLIIFLCVFTLTAFGVIAVLLITQGAPQQVTGQAQVQPQVEFEMQTVSFLPEIIGTAHAESYDSLGENLLRLEKAYPDLLEFGTAGKSSGGRELLMIKLGTGENKALFVGGIHAREHISTKYLLCCIETYCKAFHTDEGMLGSYDIRSLLSNFTLYIIPCANPDGLEIIHSREKPVSGVKVKKLAEYKANKNGVDLNRNFPLAWDSIDNGVKTPSESFFKGYSAGSEPETKALTELCRQNEFEFCISVHIKGNCIYWGDLYNTAYNEAYKAYASNIANVCALKLTNPTVSPNDYGGGFENWFRHTFSRPGFCVELIRNELNVLPLDDSNYNDFYGTVNYGSTVFLLAAAMRG